MKKNYLKPLTLACSFAVAGSILLAGCSGDGGGSTTSNQPSTAAGGAEKTEIVVGRVAPMTGALASFGKGSMDVEEAAIEALNADGGLYMEEYGKKLPIRFVLADSESDTTKASEAATKLIKESKIDVMIT